jgi:hypothetical protein
MSSGPQLRRRSSGAPAAAKICREDLDDLPALTPLQELQGLLLEFKSLGWRDMRPWGEFFERFKYPRAWTREVLDEVRQVQLCSGMIALAAVLYIAVLLPLLNDVCLRASPLAFCTSYESVEK